VGAWKPAGIDFDVPNRDGDIERESESKQGLLAKPYFRDIRWLDVADSRWLLSCDRGPDGVA
jgi:hypothetical protein